MLLALMQNWSHLMESMAVRLTCWIWHRLNGVPVRVQGRNTAVGEDANGLLKFRLRFDKL